MAVDDWGRALDLTARALASGDFGCAAAGVDDWREKFGGPVSRACGDNKQGQAAGFGGLICEQVGPVAVPRWVGSAGRLRALRGAVADHLPGAWAGKVHQLARAARGAVAVWEADSAAGDVYAHWLTKYAGADGADLSEPDIRERAEKIAARGRAGGFVANGEGVGAWGAWARLCEFVERYGGRVLPTAKIKTLKSWANRAGCAKWWRRQLRRWVAQNFERGAIELGMVGAAAGQWYCSNRAVKRRIFQIKSNEQAMRGAVIESASGQRMTLWDVAQTTVANKTIRRGELMTRIKGCEEWADAQGLTGIFTTNTCPSRFHSQLKGGGANPKYQGATPSEAQAWLSGAWARLRAKMARDELPVMGFRVAEPHHDGCPHWHMLLWCHPAHVDEITRLMRHYWLQDGGDEPGAHKYRVNIKKMLPGMAAGYVAKYIAKNIDDAHIDKHGDETETLMTVGPDLLGDMEVKPCQRVDAWASLWRIRQFQGIGQPSVSVWRELRRVTEQAAAAGSDGLIRAWLAVHRVKDKKADWAAYLTEQGGAMLRRDAYRFAVKTVDKEKAGRYETVTEKWACGVLDRRAPVLGVSPTKRERWGADGFAATRRALPWTRLNNCTAHNSQSVGRASNAVHFLKKSGVLDSEGGYFGREGGYPNQKSVESWGDYHKNIQNPGQSACMSS